MSSPFVKPELYDQVSKVLASALAPVKPFDLDFRSFRLFSNSNSTTLYLEPYQQPQDSLTRLHEIITSVVPDQKGNAFEPHIGVGFFKNHAQAEAFQRNYQSTWKSMRFTVKEIYFLHRTSQEGPWTVKAIIPLGGATLHHFRIGDTTA